MARAVRAARLAISRRPFLPVQVEVSTLGDLRAAMEAGADAVLLDNLSPARLPAFLAMAAGTIFVEVSGGIDRRNLEAYARLRPDAVSMGALTHTSRWVDLSLSLELMR